MRILIAAPYVGEIGWELMAWQGRVRWVFHRGRFDRLVVLGGAGKAAFYQDMPVEYREVDFSDLPGAAYEDRRFDLTTRQIISGEVIRQQLAGDVNEFVTRLPRRNEIDILWPEYSGRLWRCTPAEQEFIRYQHAPRSTPTAPTVVLVQRARALAAENNWPAASWEALAGELERRGIHTSIYPCEASAAIEALSCCDLAVGYSTGGLHLASLCGCPHVVWSRGDETRWTPWQMTNRQRYETFWNPLGTPVEYHGTSDAPDVRQVADWVTGALGRIGRRTGSLVCHYRTRAEWKMRTLVAWRALSSRLLRRCPWPFQQWVRYGLV